MKAFITACALLAFSPVIIALAWMARRLVTAKPYTPEELELLEDDPGVDVDLCDGCTNAMCDCHERW